MQDQTISRKSTKSSSRNQEKKMKKFVRWIATNSHSCTHVLPMHTWKRSTEESKQASVQAIDESNSWYTFMSCCFSMNSHSFDLNNAPRSGSISHSFWHAYILAFNFPFNFRRNVPQFGMCIMLLRILLSSLHGPKEIDEFSNKSLGLRLQNW